MDPWLWCDSDARYPLTGKGEQECTHGYFTKELKAGDELKAVSTHLLQGPR